MRRLRIEQLEDRRVLSSPADIVFLFDESASGDSAQSDWLADMVGQLDSRLAAEEIDRRYGLVGFGDQNVAFAHTHLVDPSDANQDSDTFFGTASQLATAAMATVKDGSAEDGWDAIEHTVAEYNFQPGAAVVFVLIQNGDGRFTDNQVFWTGAGILGALNSQNITLYSVVDASFDPDMFGAGGFVYGVEAPMDGQQGSDQVAYVENPVPNGTPTIPAGIFRDGPHDINGSTSEGETDNAYVRLAWKTDGAAWNISVILNNLSSNPAIVDQFNQFLVDSLTSRITSKLAAGQVAFEDNPVLEVNLGGPPIGSFLADNDPLLGPTFLSGTEVAVIPNPLPTIAPNGNSIQSSVPLSVFQTARKAEGANRVFSTNAWNWP